jgi:N-hydroxyarylamine O-acetyltransferase
MNLAAYLDRVKYGGPVRPDLETLRALHLAHQLAIPFEDLDVQLRRPVSMETAAIYDKIVTRRRGGWCYEMNGLMGWALREIGFDVARLSAGVMRERAGDVVLGGHLCLMVRLDQPYLVDVGFGGSLAAPLPLLEGSEREDCPYVLRLNRLQDGYWRFSETTHDTDGFSFDFRADAADEALLDRRCHFQQSDPSSSFVKSLVVQRRTRDTHVSLRGRVLKITHRTRTEKSLLESGDELVATLRERFDLDVPEAATLWPSICARHEELFGSAK